MNSFFPFLDIIILGLLALFLGFRLKNLLGDRSGYGEDVNKLETYNETKPDNNNVINLNKKKISGEGLEVLIKGDPNFSEEEFLIGAKQAFKIIIEAFVDSDVEKLLLIFSDMNKDDISQIINENINEAKKKLAFLVTTDCHSEELAKEAEKKAVSIFEQNSYDNLDEIIFQKNDKINILDALMQKNLVASKSEGKRLIDGGGIKINDLQIKEYNYILNQSNNDQVLKMGKKKLFKIKFN